MNSYSVKVLLKPLSEASKCSGGYSARPMGACGHCSVAPTHRGSLYGDGRRSVSARTRLEASSSLQCCTRMSCTTLLRLLPLLTLLLAHRPRPNIATTTTRHALQTTFLGTLLGNSSFETGCFSYAGTTTRLAVRGGPSKPQ